nr:hypothetical protein GCM10020093_076900 [Planobispora longispora]
MVCSTPPTIPTIRPDLAMNTSSRSTVCSWPDEPGAISIDQTASSEEPREGTASERKVMPSSSKTGASARFAVVILSPKMVNLIDYQQDGKPD